MNLKFGKGGKNQDEKALTSRTEKQTNSAAVKRGTISAALIAVGVVICIIFNLVVAQLPTSIMEIDLSTEKIYTVSDTSVEFLAELEDDIVITALVQDGDLDDRISKFLDNYCALSDHVSWQQIDPVKYPSALTTYDAEEGQFVVYNTTEGTSELIESTDILVYDWTYYYYYGTLYYTDFDAEGQFTSAINRLTSDTTKLIYLTEGHGEGSLSDSVISLLGKSQLDTDTVNLLTTGEIPEDCDELMILGPTSDFGEDEIALIEDYLAEGGKVTILLDDEGTDTPNLDGLLETYGLTLVEGYIAETAQGYYYQVYGNYAIFPSISSVSGISSSLSSDATVLLYGARGMEVVDPARDTITVTTFMTTSDSALAVTTNTDGETVTTEGQYVLGAVATEEIDDETTARLTVYSTNSIIDENVTAVSSSLANETLFVNSVAAGFDDIENLSIESKSLEVSYNTITPWMTLSATFIIIIPAVILVVGLVIWLRRRRK